VFPEEVDRHPILSSQVARGEDVAARSNMTGHITTSAIVLNPAGSRVLLIHHKVFNFWLPPGGHYECGASLWKSSVREAIEETGITRVFEHAWTQAHSVPVDIDTHPIPANPSKREGKHVHHDFCFLAVALDNEPLRAQEDEVNDARWVPAADLRNSSDARVRALHAKLTRLGVL
jgi:ADP-ribose pyrophosphatase YjhB (NUDIX family)